MIGIVTPTHARPYMARSAALQFNNQTKKPNIVCFHQNGTKISYKKFVDDLILDYKLHWIHTPENIHQDEWYCIPIKYLLEQNCKYIFWCDDDDIYYSNHIEESIELIEHFKSDILIRNMCDCLKFYDNKFEFVTDTSFTAHADAGLSSSMVFTSKFALELIKDCELNIQNKITGKEFYQFTDQIVHWVTSKKFKKSVVSKTSICYSIHRDSMTSSCWI